MAISYQAKDSIVLGRELKVQELSIPFVVTANATPGSVSILNDDPAILTFTTEGTDSIGPVITATSDTLPTTYGGTEDQSNGTFLGGIALPAASDASGIFYAMYWIKETLVKVISAEIVSRSNPGGEPSASFSVVGTVTDPATVNLLPGTIQSTTNNEDKAYILFSSASFDFATTNLDAVLTIKYVVQE